MARVRIYICGCSLISHVCKCTHSQENVRVYVYIIHTDTCSDFPDISADNWVKVDGNVKMKQALERSVRRGSCAEPHMLGPDCV